MPYSRALKIFVVWSLIFATLHQAKRVLIHDLISQTPRDIYIYTTPPGAPHGNLQGHGNQDYKQTRSPPVYNPPTEIVGDTQSSASQTIASLSVFSIVGIIILFLICCLVPES